MRRRARYTVADALSATLLGDEVYAIADGGLLALVRGQRLASIRNPWMVVAGQNQLFVSAENRIHVFDAESRSMIAHYGGLDGSDLASLCPVPEGDGVLAIGGGEEGALREFRVGQNRAVARAGGYRIANTTFLDDERVVVSAIPHATSHVFVLDRNAKPITEVGDVGVSFNGIAPVGDAIFAVSEDGAYTLALKPGAKPERVADLDGAVQVAPLDDKFVVATRAGTVLLTSSGTVELVDDEAAEWVDVRGERAVVVNPGSVSVFTTSNA